MTREQFIEDKRKALIENRLAMAQTIFDCAQDIIAALPKRKATFRKRDRTPKKMFRQKMAASLFAYAFKLRSHRIQDHIIRSQPIPNYVKGGVHTSDLAVVSRNNKEIIVTPSGNIITAP